MPNFNLEITTVPAKASTCCYNSHAPVTSVRLRKRLYRGFQTYHRSCHLQYRLPTYLHHTKGACITGTYAIYGVRANPPPTLASLFLLVRMALRVRRSCPALSLSKNSTPGDAIHYFSCSIALSGSKDNDESCSACYRASILVWSAVVMLFSPGHHLIQEI